jgi:peroxiredoxin Q/BCP
MLRAGIKAPGFTAQNQDGKTIRLDDFAWKRNVVLYFFPKDRTPG